MKKKLIASSILLFGMLAFQPTTVAAETTEVSANCPSDYVVMIPPDQVITERKAEIGEVSIYGTIEPGKIIRLTTTSDEFIHENGVNKVPFIVKSNNVLWTEDTWNEAELIQGQEKSVPLGIEIGEMNWLFAKPGSYRAKIIYKTKIE